MCRLGLREEEDDDWLRFRELVGSGPRARLFSDRRPIPPWRGVVGFTRNRDIVALVQKKRSTIPGDKKQLKAQDVTAKYNIESTIKYHHCRCRFSFE